MPRYLAIHHAPGVSQEDFQRNIPEVLAGKHATFVQTYVNLQRAPSSTSTTPRASRRWRASSSASASPTTRSRRSSSPPPPTTCARWRAAPDDGDGHYDGGQALVRRRGAGQAAAQGQRVREHDRPPGHARAAAAVPLLRPGRHRADGGAVAVAAGHCRARTSTTTTTSPRSSSRIAGDGALLATGQLYLQQGTHGVTTFLSKPDAPEGQSYQISLIIIRMKAGRPAERGVHPPLPELQRGRLPRGSRRLGRGAQHAYYPELANVRFYADAADEFNAEPRRCAECGAAAAALPRRARRLAALRAVRRAGQPRATRARARGGQVGRDAARTQEDAQRVPGRERGLGLVRRVSRRAARAPIRCRT